MGACLFSFASLAHGSPFFALGFLFLPLFGGPAGAGVFFMCFFFFFFLPAGGSLTKERRCRCALPPFPLFCLALLPPPPCRGRPPLFPLLFSVVCLFWTPGVAPRSALRLGYVRVLVQGRLLEVITSFCTCGSPSEWSPIVFHVRGPLSPTLPRKWTVAAIGASQRLS